MEHMMLDLETMSTEPNAAIVAIGAVMFDARGTTPEKQIGPSFYAAISLASNERFGRHISASTVTWWLKQEPQARLEVANANLDLREALMMLQSWCGTQCDQGVLKVWGNGSDFDNVILNSAYKEQRLLAPWKYSHNRCYRTMRACLPKVDVPFAGVYHNALDDAINQARYLIQAVQAAGNVVLA